MAKKLKVPHVDLNDPKIKKFLQIYLDNRVASYITFIEEERGEQIKDLTKKAVHTIVETFINGDESMSEDNDNMIADVFETDLLDEIGKFFADRDED